MAVSRNTRVTRLLQRTEPGSGCALGTSLPASGYSPADAHPCFVVNKYIVLPLLLLLTPKIFFKEEFQKSVLLPQPMSTKILAHTNCCLPHPRQCHFPLVLLHAALPVLFGVIRCCSGQELPFHYLVMQHITKSTPSPWLGLQAPCTSEPAPTGVHQCSLSPSMSHLSWAGCYTAAEHDHLSTNSTSISRSAGLPWKCLQKQNNILELELLRVGIAQAEHSPSCCLSNIVIQLNFFVRQ